MRWYNKSVLIFVLYLVAVCSFDSLTNQFLFCVLWQFTVQSYNQMTTWEKNPPATGFYPGQQGLYYSCHIFHNVFAIYVFPCSLPMAQPNCYKICVCITNWCKSATFGYILNNYKWEALCWYYIPHQLVRTWCGYNDLNSLCSNWCCHSSGYHIFSLCSLNYVACWIFV